MTTRPLQETVRLMMLSLRRRYLERRLDGPYNDSVSRELDAVIIEQEQIIDRHTTTKGAGDEDR